MKQNDVVTGFWVRMMFLAFAVGMLVGSIVQKMEGTT